MLLPAAMVDAQVKFGYLSYSEAIKAMPGYADMQKSLAELKISMPTRRNALKTSLTRSMSRFLRVRKTLHLLS